MIIQKGYRGKLLPTIDISKPFTTEITVAGDAEFDLSCFGVDSDDKLSDERYMIFYNQLASPENAIEMTPGNNSAVLRIDLSKLPDSIVKLVFTINTDENHNMQAIKSGRINISQPGSEIIELPFENLKFEEEKAIIAIEIYKKDDWRLSAVMAGFNGGLSALLAHYGGVEAKEDEESTPPSQVQQANITQAPSEGSAQKHINKGISLEKKLERAPALVSLAKPLKVVLEKHNLMDVEANVVLVMDMSASMTARYLNGTVQMIVDKVVPIAIQFDTDGKLDMWYFSALSKQMKPVTIDNYQTAVPKTAAVMMIALGVMNYEPGVMRKIIKKYKDQKLPTYVIFITDGSIMASKEIEKLMIESSAYPIFWQFIGVSGSDYGILLKIDTMDGRKVDNANFFALDDFKTVPNDELYSRMLAEFPEWLRKAKEIGIIR